MINVEINPDDLNKMVVEAILKSSIGDALQAVIDKAVKELSQSYNNPIEPVVKRLLADLIEKQVRANYTDALKAKVDEVVKSHLTDDLLIKLVEEGVRRYA